MRIIFLNTWNGKVHDKLIRFILDESSKTDIFCFQEVGKPLFKNLQKVLPGFNSWRTSKDYINSWKFEQAIFSKKQVDFTSDGEDFLNVGGGLAGILNIEDKKIILCNVHGVSLPGHKFDNDERIAQSKGIIEFIKKQNIPIIIGGDLNLMPKTESIELFEKAGFRNLIKEFKIEATRNKLAWEYYKDKPDFVKQHFSDYVFVSPEVKVTDFEVVNNEISDHLPLMLDFTI